MRNTLTIAKRELLGYFNGPVAYIVICIVLLLLGYFFWQSFFLMGRASVRDLFQLLTMFLILAAPALSMGLLAEERRTGTLELLITMPVKDWEVVLGKYLGVMGLYSTLLLLTLPYPISVSTLGTLDWGPVLGGYLGIFLHGGALLALGLMASSFTNNQLIALFVAAFLGFVFWICGQILPFLPSWAARTAQWLSLDFHLRNMARGVIDTRDLFYFFTIIGISLAIAFRSLESRRWRG
ncbi:MAG: ABC transporter permease [Myxococcota bacterium]